MKYTKLYDPGALHKFIKNILVMCIYSAKYEKLWQAHLSKWQC